MITRKRDCKKRETVFTVSFMYLENNKEKKENTKIIKNRKRFFIILHILLNKKCANEQRILMQILNISHKYNSMTFKNCQVLIMSLSNIFL